MKKVLSLAVILVALLLTSCSSGYYKHYTSNNNVNQTQVVLSQNNFRVVKTVETTVIIKNAHAVFKKAQLEQSVYAALLKEANLQGAQVLIDVNIEEVVRGTSSKTESAVHATGVVIEFTK